MSNLLNLQKTELEKFLKESNAIESEYTKEAFENAWKAWKFLICFEELTLSRILECHRILMTDLNNRIAGKIRNVNVRVGFSSKLDFNKIKESINKLLLRDSHTEEQIKQWHIDFENIHPFEDGNGRIGRILYNFQRIKNGLPIHIIYEKNKYEYYDWFLNDSSQNLF